MKHCTLTEEKNPERARIGRPDPASFIRNTRSSSYKSQMVSVTLRTACGELAIVMSSAFSCQETPLRNLVRVSILPSSLAEWPRRYTPQPNEQEFLCSRAAGTRPPNQKFATVNMHKNRTPLSGLMRSCLGPQYIEGILLMTGSLRFLARCNYQTPRSSVIIHPLTDL